MTSILGFVISALTALVHSMVHYSSSGSLSASYIASAGSNPSRSSIIILVSSYFVLLSFCLSNAMHGQNINLPVCVCQSVYVRHTFCQLAYRSDRLTFTLTL